MYRLGFGVLQRARTAKSASWSDRLIRITCRISWSEVDVRRWISEVLYSVVLTGRDELAGLI